MGARCSIEKLNETFDGSAEAGRIASNAPHYKEKRRFAGRESRGGAGADALSARFVNTA